MNHKKLLMLTPLLILVLSFAPMCSSSTAKGSITEMSVSSSSIKYISTISHTCKIETGTGGDGVGTYAWQLYNYKNIFDWNKSPLSSYHSIKVVDTNRIYVTTSSGSVVPDPGFSLVYLDTCNPVVDTLTSSEIQIHWDTIENLRIFQRIYGVGTTVSDAHTYVAHWVTNLDTVNHSIGVRWEWDVEIDWWSGFELWVDGGPWLDKETEWSSPTFSDWRAWAPPYPIRFVPLKPGRSKLIFASWQNSFKAAYSYTPTGKVIFSKVSGNYPELDACILHYWGSDPIEIPPGDTWSVEEEIPVAEAPVGGIYTPVDKFALLAPYIALASTILVATAATAIYVKRVKRRKKKQ